MQTVVMSFGRNQYLEKPDLPINHVHVYFPVQVVHKLVERCCALRLQDVTPQEGKRYKHNSEQNPYIIVRAYEGQCVSDDYPAVPPTPNLANACEQGILDASYGQMISFASSYKSGFRLEVPAWYNVAEGGGPGRGKSKLGQGTGGRGQGTGGSKLETGNWGQGPGDRELEAGNRELGTGNWGQGTGGRDWGQGTGAGNWGQQTGDRELGRGHLSG